MWSRTNRPSHVSLGAGRLASMPGTLEPGLEMLPNLVEKTARPAARDLQAVPNHFMRQALVSQIENGTMERGQTCHGFLQTSLRLVCYRFVMRAPSWLGDLLTQG